MNKLLRHLRIYKILVKLSFIREMAFRANFFIWFAVFAVDFAIYYFFYNSIYNNIDLIADWSKYEWLFYLGYEHIILAIFTGMFMDVVGLPNSINRGNLDYILLKPIDSQFLASLGCFRLGYLSNAIPGIILMIYCIPEIDFSISLLSISAAIIYTLVGLSILFSILLIISIIAIWIKRASFVSPLFVQLTDFMRMPKSIFGKVTGAIFTYILPILLVCSAPVGILISKPNTTTLVITLAVGIFWFTLSRMLWKFSLKHYEGASS